MRAPSVGTGEGEVSFPAVVPLLPRGGDAERRFEVVAELEDDGGVVFAGQRVIAGFVPGELREVWIRFEAACAGVLDCAAGTTCVAGVCEPACMVPVPVGADPQRVACPEPGCAAAEDGTACDGGTCRLGECCTGCWNEADGRCEDGTTVVACGAGGTLCEACCDDDVACTAGQCDPAIELGGPSAGFAHACVIAMGGELWCWGANASGQLGDGTTADATVPVRGTVMGSFGEVAAGGTSAPTGAGHTCAIDWTNELYCWGTNDLGQLGSGDLAPVTGAVHVSPGSTWDTVSAGGQHTCAIDRVGGLWCWGQNADGIVGEAGFGGIVATPTQIGVGMSWTGVDTFRRHACALSGASLHCWGLNRDGALEVGSGDDGVAGPMPVMLDYLGEVTSVAAGGFFTCALSQASGALGGAVRCWGINAGGQLGRPMGALASDPIGGIEDFLIVSAGLDHACGIRADGSLWCWGRNALGQVGSGSSAEVVFTPERVGDRADWLSVEPGGTFTCGVRERGTLWCWGDGSRGQLGIAGVGNTRTPARVCVSP
jgi:alpha-tubulin suppressor-like RCC1 family protein